jgi:tetratricopeptide (TPR) repeat protein
MTGPRVGRILLESERAARMADEGAGEVPGEILRSAFVISAEHVLTAWHCVRGAASGGEGLWFRLRDTGARAAHRYRYLPLRVLGHDEASDIAVLCLDSSRLRSVGLPRKAAGELLAHSVIPLGTDVDVYDRVRVMGFPVNTSSADSDTLPVTVIDVALSIGKATVMKLIGESFSAVDPVNPRGLSGGPVLRQAAVGGEMAVGVIRQVPKGLYENTALGGAVIATRIADAAQALPQVAAALRASQSTTWADRGDTLSRAGQLKEAEAAYRDALAADSGCARAHAGLGGVLATWWRFDEAEAACREAIRLDAALPAAHVALADVLRRTYWLDNAEAACREAIRLDPGFAQAHSVLGVVLCDLEQLEAAETSCREAVRLDPSLAAAHYNLGAVLCHSSQLGAAEAACREGVRLAPGDAMSHYVLADVLRRRGWRAAAEAAYRQAIKADPLSVIACADLGAFLITDKRYQEAEAVCREAVSLAPNMALAYLNLGRALQGMNRDKEARVALSRAVKLDPSVAYGPNPLRSQTFQRISRDINQHLFGG